MASAMLVFESNDEQEEHQRCDALEGMSKELRAECAAIERMIDQKAGNMVRFYHRVGERLASIATRYGQGAVERIADALKKSEATIYRARALFRWMPTKEALENLLKRRGTNGKPLEWSQLLTLLAVDEDQREQLLKEALECGLTTRQLQARIAKLKSPAETEPRPSPPRGFAGALTHIDAMAGRLAERLAAPFDLRILQPLTRINDAVESDVLDRIAKARQTLAAVATEATRRAQALADLEARLSTLAEAQARAPADSPPSNGGKTADAPRPRKERRPSTA
jgi:hypothetical protein